jgi:hypothetical protein
LRRSTILVLLIPLAAGCGDSEKQSPAQANSRAAYARQADDVCRQADAALTSLKQPSGVTELPAYARRAAAIVSSERDHLKALKAPPGDAGRVKDLGEALDAVVRVANGLVDVAATGDPSALTDYVNQNGAADRKAKKLAGELGMKVCAAP